MYTQGRVDALALQGNADNMTGTELHDSVTKVPMFKHEVQYLEYSIGFTCRTAQGNVVRLIQPYDSTIYTQEPEELHAQWGFKWSTNPKHATPFISISTSPYMKDDCCTENEKIYRSTIDNNTWLPSDYPQGWEEVVE